MKIEGVVIRPLLFLYRLPFGSNIIHYHPLCAVNASLYFAPIEQFFAPLLLVAIPNIRVVQQSVFESDINVVRHFSV